MASDKRIALCVARFYDDLADKLESGARAALSEAGITDVDRFTVPGAFELPLIARYSAESGRYDAIVCPVASSPAGHGSATEEDFIYTLPFSLTGYPCVAVRTGTSPEGLPIGVQVVARPWRDDVALRLAGEIERSAGWTRPPLPL